MIAIIRIAGQTGINTQVVETLSRLKMRKKFVCVLIDEKDEIRMGMLKRVKDHVSYGKVDEKLIEELKKKRGTDAAKGFFRLHPPIGGFKKSTKLACGTGKGILGENKDIDKLIRRML